MKRKYARWMIMGLITCMAVALTACAGSAGSKQPQTDLPADTSPAQDKGAVEITFSAMQDMTGATQRVVETFNQLHEGEIKVNFIELPSDVGKQHDLYVTSFSSGGSEYDVFVGDCVWPAEFSHAEYVMPLDRFIERDQITLDDYLAGSIGAATFQGKLWALPANIDAGMLYYRSDLVDKAPETWDELLEMSQSAKSAGADMGYVSQAKQYEGVVCNALEFIAAYGGEVIDADGNVVIQSPETIEGLNMMKKIFTSDSVPSNITTFTENETLAAFVEGKSAFARNWIYMWALANAEDSKVSDKIAVAPMPKGPACSASCLGGRMGMINKNSLHPEEAWEFLKYYCGEEGQKIMSIQGGQTPVLMKLFDDPEVLEATPFYADEQFVESLLVTIPRPVTPAYTKLSEIMQIELSKMLSGEISAETAVANMDAQMKEAVAAIG